MTNEESALWSVVVFKVEDTIFQVPQHRFTEHSEVFADMFHIPQAGDGESVEGRDKEHPIVLHGYQVADFRALMKVLYPSPSDVISGSYTLTKDEWVGVLNLSTRWQMKMMREHAITKLSKMSLTSVEKVTLARAHKVAKWLKEGLSDIVTREETLEPDELKSHVGLETAFRLMWIQNQSLKTSRNLSDPKITLASLGCPNCQTAMFNSAQRCHYCSWTISVNASNAIHHPSSVGANLSVNLQNLRCRACSNQPLYPQSYGCPSCHSVISYTNFKLIGIRQNPGSDVKVDEVFKEEIGSYESWDQ